MAMTETTSEAVEADAFLRIYEAFEDASRKIQIPMRHLCPVRKVVWSSFDYMSGPELGFTWEAVAGANDPTSSSDKSSLSGGSRDGSSLTSSITKADSGADYEDIDDVYRSELLTEAVSDLQVCAMCMRTHSGGDLVCDSCNLASGLPYDAFKMDGDERLYLDEFMTESRSTVDGTTTLTDGDDEHLKHLASLTSMSRSGDLESCSDKDNCAQKVTLSSEFAAYKANSLSSSQITVLTHTSSLAGDVESLRHDGVPTKSSEESQAMVSSGVDSGIAGTVSMHSDLSTAASSHAKELSEAKENRKSIQKMNTVADDCTVIDNNKTVEDYAEEDEHTIVEHDENADYEALCDLAGGNGSVNLSDEEYVAKFVLAEQICSTPMPSNPVMHKLTLLPKRHLFVGSYLFQAKSSSRPDRAMYAVSLLGDISSWDWYTERQNVIEEMFVDIIPRIRISYLTESIEDFICRATKEISRILSVLGVCEIYPLLSRSTGHDIRIRQTYFGDGKLQDSLFLAKAITAVLLSQSHCIVVGDGKAAVAKMLLTLCLFVAPEWRWLCIRPYQHPFSPYLRLQAVQRTELINVMHTGTESHWPLAIIDLDRQVVCTASPYPKHRTLKLLKQKSDIIQILKGYGVDLKDSGMPKIELRNCHADARVKDFLIKMDLLPFENSTRLGFVRQFRLVIENSARALIACVQDVSEPDSSYKRHATSSKWSLWTTRKSLDLTSNSAFLVTLAEAERILPDIADFICESKAL